MKYIVMLAACLGSTLLHAQELYPYTEPASNMPSHSISGKLGGMFEKEVHTNKTVQRYSPEIMFGINKAWMMHAAGTISDMQQETFRGESVRLYTKYRFFSADDVHKHFRMAAFALGSYSRNKPLYNELNLYGDHTGVQAGIIATQLVNKIAVSGTASLIELLNSERWKEDPIRALAWRAVNYSLSVGYLLLPFEYTSFKQTNVNLYAELLGNRNLGAVSEKYFVDLAPAVQFIFNSTSKLNFGYRFQLAGDVDRMAKRSFMISYERIFLDALRRNKK